MGIVKKFTDFITKLFISCKDCGALYIDNRISSPRFGHIQVGIEYKTCKECGSKNIIDLGSQEEFDYELSEKV